MTAGASAALSLACCALVDPGASVLMTDPGYPCNRHFVTAFDGVPQLVAVGPETRFQLTRGMVEAHWRAGTRGALIASPANPTGTSIPFDELGRIVDTVRARGGFTIVDEIYLGLSYDGAPRSALAWGDDLVVTNSFSKYFHMTGWRLGWLVVPEALAPVFEKLAQNLYICASTLAQHARSRASTPNRSPNTKRDAANSSGVATTSCRPCGKRPAGAGDAGRGLLRVRRLQRPQRRQFGVRARIARAHPRVGGAGQDFGRHEPSRYLRPSYATSMDRLHEAIARLARYLPARERQRG